MNPPSSKQRLSQNSMAARLLLCAWLWSSPSHAQVPSAPASAPARPTTAATLAASVCAACHGANGKSFSPGTPHLAGQRVGYSKAQLEAFRSGLRISDLMNAVASQLSVDEISKLAEHFSALDLASDVAHARSGASALKTHVVMPARFDVGYTVYLVTNEANSRVNVWYANDVALKAAAAGRALPDGSKIFIAVHRAKLGADQKPERDAQGKFVPGAMLSASGRAREAGWGEHIPAQLRNENWNYALFGADRAIRTSVNQAECLACHKPRAAQSFLFFDEQLTAAARKAVAGG